MELTPTVHGRGSATRLDQLFDLVRFVTQPKPLLACLDELPRFIAQVFSADVCSIYILEGNDLVMRGNVGFAQDAVSEVRLAVGEGVTGVAVECMRPISLAMAQDHERYRHFDQLGEDRFPVFVAVPVLGPVGPLGALVLQRRQLPAFSQDEIELAVALTVPISSVVERARLVDAIKAQHRQLPAGTRRVTLSGRTALRGRAFGRAFALRRPTGNRSQAPVRAANEAAALLERVTLHIRRQLEALRHKSAVAAAHELIDPVFIMLDDGRLRERALQRCAEGSALEQALLDVGGEVARAAKRAGDSFSLQRADALSDLCEALAVMCSAKETDSVMPGAVLMGDRLTLFDVLVSVRPHARAIALSEPHASPGAKAMLDLIGLPTVTDVHGLFRWVADGDVVLVDADHGLVRVNPSRADIALLREEQRGDRPPQ